MNEEAPLATIERIWRYPVKSLAAQPLEHARIGAGGLEGDRRSALFVTTEAHARNENTFRGKEHNRLHTVGAPEQGRALAEAAGVDVVLRTEGPYYDAGAVSLLFDRWVEELEELVGRELDPQRFRPNLYARAKRPIPSERGLVGALLEIGGVLLRVNKHIERCVTITYDVPSGASDPEILRALATLRENTLGVYCTVERPGEIAAGDEVRVRGALPTTSPT